MATSSDEMNTKLSWRRFEDGDNQWGSFTDKIFNEDTSHKCPTYVHKTPPCQGSCPSGEDIRGWLAIVRGQEKPVEGMEMGEYAFRRSTDANPFPSMMGRVCPAPCQDGCNRNEVEDFVGINAVEQWIGDNALANGYQFEAGPSTGKKVAIKPNVLRMSAAEEHIVTHPAVLQAVVEKVESLSARHGFEALHIVGIHPERPARSLTGAELENLWQTLVRLLQIGVRYNRIITADPADVGKPRGRRQERQG